MLAKSSARSRRHAAVQKLFGDRVRARRRAVGWTQQMLADRSGLDRSFVSGIERGVRNVSLVSVVELAVALQVEPSDLLTGLTQAIAPRRGR